MKYKEWLGRAALAVLMAIALRAAPTRARADDVDTDPGLDGLGNVVSYSLCAGGIFTGAFSGNLNTLLGAMVYCRNVYREAI
jgi:hypothetical protein